MSELNIGQARLLAELARIIVSQLRSRDPINPRERFGDHMVELIDDAIQGAEAYAEFLEQVHCQREMAKEMERQMERDMHNEEIRRELYGTPGDPK